MIWDFFSTSGCFFYIIESVKIKIKKKVDHWYGFIASIIASDNTKMRQDFLLSLTISLHSH